MRNPIGKCRMVPPLKDDEVKRSKAHRSSWSSPAIRAKMAARGLWATECSAS